MIAATDSRWRIDTGQNTRKKKPPLFKNDSEGFGSNVFTLPLYVLFQPGDPSVLG